MSLWDGIKDVAIGVGCIAAAPVAVAVACEAAAVSGALAITAGIVSEATAVTSGVALMSAAESAATNTGRGKIIQGVKKIVND